MTPIKTLARSLLICGMVASAIATSAQAQTVSLRAAYVPVVTWLPAWVAKEQGIFKKHGMDVTLTPIQNLSTLPGAVGKQFDFAPSTGPDLLKAAASGIDVVAVAGETIETGKDQSVFIMVRPDSGIKSIADLKGKRVATPTVGAVIHISLLHWLKKEGVNPDSIEAVEVPFPNMADQLKASRVDAVEALEPFVGQMRQAGYVSLGDPLLSVGDPVLFPFWIAEGSWARQHQPLIKDWIAALTEAEAFIRGNNQAARSILAKYTRLPDAIAQKIPFPAYRFAIAPEQLDVWERTIRDLGQLPAPLDVSKLVVTAG